VNLRNIKNTNIGFGPFMLFGHNIFPDQVGVKIYQKLQQYSDSGFPVLRSTGSQYVVLARKKCRTNFTERKGIEYALHIKERERIA
jgi:hypothetical protein